MKLKITFMHTWLCCMAMCAQAPAIQWQKSFGGLYADGAKAIRQTADGGYIVAGNSTSNDGDVSGHHGFTNSSSNPDFWVVKTDGTGTIQWQTSLGGSQLDEATYIEPTSDGGYAVIGTSASIDGNVTGNHAGGEVWIVKLNSNGTIQWQNTMGGSGSDAGQFIRQTSDGGYVIAAYTNTPNDGDVSGLHINNMGNTTDAWIIKLDVLGNIQWQKCLGGTNNEVANAVEPTTGGYIVSGYTNSADGDVTGWHTSSPGTYLLDYWVVKLDNTGNILWQKALGGSMSDEGTTIMETIVGDYVVGGFSSSNDGDITAHHGTTAHTDIWMAKLNSSNGNLIWEKSLGGTNNESGDIRPTSDGGFIIASNSNSNDGDVSANYGDYDYWVAKLNATGTIQWEKSYGGSGFDGATSVAQTADGSYILAGASNSSDGNVTGNHGNTDYWVVKLEPDTATAETACAIWDLSTSGAVTSVSGNVTAQQETVSSGNSSPSMNIYGYSNGQQLWCGNSTGWVGGPVDFSRYIEFNTAPTSGNSFTINSVSFDYNDYPWTSDMNTLAFDVYYSTDGWSNSTYLGSGAYLNTIVQTFNASLNSTVSNGDTFSLRIFPYALQNSSATIPSFATHQTITICGETATVETGTGSICGTVFNDLNGDGILNSETGLAGWQVNLSGPNGLTATVTSDTNGQYCFNNLPEGLFSVTEVLPAGWQQTAPFDPGFYSNGVYYYYLGLSNGQSISGIDFGNIAINEEENACIVWDLTTDQSVSSTTGNITGLPEIITQMQLWDYNSGQRLTVSAGNGMAWPPEAANPARYIEFNAAPSAGNDLTITQISFDYNDNLSTGTDFNILYFDVAYSTNNWSSSTTLGSNSVYQGSGVSTFTATLLATVPNGGNFSLRIFPHSPGGSIAGTPSFAVHSYVTLCGSTTPAQTTYSGSICGAKFNDINGNGTWEVNEPGISGWQINLTASNGDLYTTTLTDTTGNYCFNNVPAGYFLISETQQEGWEQTLPADSDYYLLGLGEGGIYTEVDFGNHATGGDAEDACVINYLTENACGGLTTGNITNDGCSMSMGSEPLMMVYGYDALYGQSLYANGGWQAGSLDPTRYIAFNVKPNPGYDLTVTNISFDYTDLGPTNNVINGQVEYVVGSGNTWATYPLGNITYSTTGVQTFTVAINQLVPDGQILILHIYLWSTQNEGSIPYLPTHKNVTFCGTTSTALAVDTPAPDMQILLYPNPSNGTVNLRIAEFDNQSTTIIIYDMLGKKVLETPIKGNNTTLQLQSFQNGLYDVLVAGVDGIRFRKRMILLKK